MARLASIAGLLIFQACARPTASPASSDRAPPPETATATATPAPLFGDGLGLHVKFAEGQPESELAMLVDLGVRWARDSVAWPHMEPSPGAYRPFPPDFARRLAFYKEHDIGVVFIVAFSNPVAYPPRPEEPLRSIDPAAYARYAVHVATLLRHAGVRFVLELWNEPHGFTVRELAGGTWNGAPPSPWVAHYVRMVREATHAVKALDPTIPVLDDDDMWILHYRFMEAGLPADLDGFAFHPYTRHEPSAGALRWYPPEHTAVESDTPWTRPFVVVDRDAAFESAVARLREAGAHALGRPPALWITEWGYHLGDQGEHGRITEDVIAAYLPRAFVLSASAGARATCWFSSEDQNDGTWGLVANDGRKRKAYDAYRAMSRALGRSSFVRRVAGETHRTSGLQAYLFCEPAARCTLVAWDAGDVSRHLRLDGVLARATVTDVYGAPLAPAPLPDGTRAIPIGAAPVYVSGLGRDAPLAGLEARLD